MVKEKKVRNQRQRKAIEERDKSIVLDYKNFMGMNDIKENTKFQNR